MIESAFMEFLKLLNILFIPGLIYIVKLEKRITRLETTLDSCLRRLEKGAL